MEGDGVLGNPPLNPEDIIGWYWDCFAPDSMPENVHCEWTPIPAPWVDTTGRAQ